MLCMHFVFHFPPHTPKWFIGDLGFHLPLELGSASKAATRANMKARLYSTQMTNAYQVHKFSNILFLFGRKKIQNDFNTVIEGHIFFTFIKGLVAKCQLISKCLLTKSIIVPDTYLMGWNQWKISHLFKCIFTRTSSIFFKRCFMNRYKYMILFKMLLQKEFHFNLFWHEFKDCTYIAPFQKVRCLCQISKISIPNYYPELEIWISRKQLRSSNLKLRIVILNRYLFWRFLKRIALSEKNTFSLWCQFYKWMLFLICTL
jgi:hypothetical protein